MTVQSSSHPILDNSHQAKHTTLVVLVVVVVLVWCFCIGRYKKMKTTWSVIIVRHDHFPRPTRELNINTPFMDAFMTVHYLLAQIEYILGVLWFVVTKHWFITHLFSFEYTTKWIVCILIDVMMASNRYFHTRGKECKNNEEEEEENVYVKDEFVTVLRSI